MAWTSQLLLLHSARKKKKKKKARQKLASSLTRDDGKHAAESNTTKPSVQSTEFLSGLCSNEQANYSCMGIITLDYSRYSQLPTLSITLSKKQKTQTNKKHTLFQCVGFFFSPKTNFITLLKSPAAFVLSSVELHYRCHKLNWQTSQLAIKQQW